MDVIKLKQYHTPISHIVKLNTPDYPYFVKLNFNTPLLIEHYEVIGSLEEGLKLYRDFPFYLPRNLLLIKSPSQSKVKNMYKYYLQGIKYETLNTREDGLVEVKTSTNHLLLVKYDVTKPFTFTIRNSQNFIINNIQIQPNMKIKFNIVENEKYSAVYYAFVDYWKLTFDIIHDYATLPLQEVYDIISLKDGFEYVTQAITYDVLGTYIKNKTRVKINAIIVERR